MEGVLRKTSAAANTQRLHAFPDARRRTGPPLALLRSPGADATLLPASVSMRSGAQLRRCCIHKIDDCRPTLPQGRRNLALTTRKRQRTGQTMLNRLPSFRRRGTRRPEAGASTGQPNRSQGMSYIDGFVIAVPTANKQKFIEHPRPRRCRTDRCRAPISGQRMSAQGRAAPASRLKSLPGTCHQN